MGPLEMGHQTPFLLTSGCLSCSPRLSARSVLPKLILETLVKQHQSGGNTEHPTQLQQWPGLTAQIPSPAPRTAQLPPFVLTQYKAPLSDANTPRHLSASQQTGHLKGYLKGSQASDEFPQRGSPQNTQPILLVTVKVIKSKENLRNHQIQEELNEV